MKLFKSITVLVFLLSTTLSSAQWGNGKKIKGNGDITTVKRTTSDYEGLKAAGPMDFILVEGTEGNITIKADANLIDYIVTEVKNNTHNKQIACKKEILPLGIGLFFFSG